VKKKIIIIEKKDLTVKKADEQRKRERRLL